MPIDYKRWYVNGYGTFEIVMSRPATADKVFQFSFKFMSMTEYRQRKSIRKEYLNGKKRKRDFYVNYWWVISYEEFIENKDNLKWTQIENLEIAGWELEFIPHSEEFARERKFKGQLIDEERRLDMWPHNRGLDTTPNSGMVFAIENTEPQLNVNTWDPNVWVDPEEVAGGGTGLPFEGIQE